jgi:hypothetical protein
MPSAEIFIFVCLLEISNDEVERYYNFVNILYQNLETDYIHNYYHKF